MRNWNRTKALLPALCAVLLIAAIAMQSPRQRRRRSDGSSDSGTPTYGELDIGALTDRLLDRIEQMKAGDMSEAEAMLLGQAHALQAIFVNLSRRTVKQEYLKQWETYMRMAMKAQSQCRMTLETLTTLKNWAATH